jgi:hypothetical protein
METAHQEKWCEALRQRSSAIVLPLERVSGEPLYQVANPQTSCKRSPTTSPCSLSPRSEEQLSGAEHISEGLGQRSIRAPRDAKRSGDGLRHEQRIGERRQLHPPDAVLELLHKAGCGLKGEARFAAAAGAGEGEQPARQKQLSDRGQLAFAANEPVQLERQIMRQRSILMRRSSTPARSSRSAVSIVTLSGGRGAAARALIARRTRWRMLPGSSSRAVWTSGSTKRS